MNTQTCEEAKKVGGAQKLLQFLEKLRPMFETLALRRGTGTWYGCSCESSHLFGPSIWGATMPRYTFCNNWIWSGRLCPYTTWQRKWEQKARLVSHLLVEFQLMWINIKGVQVVMFDFEDHPTAWNWPGQVINQVDRAWKVPSFWRSAGDRLKRQKWKLVAGFVPMQDVRKLIHRRKCRSQVIAILYLIVTY